MLENVYHAYRAGLVSDMHNGAATGAGVGKEARPQTDSYEGVTCQLSNADQYGDAISIATQLSNPDMGAV